jgi:hypothetical protein
LELLGLIPDAAVATTQEIETARQVIDDWLDVMAPGATAATSESPYKPEGH